MNSNQSTWFLSLSHLFVAHCRPTLARGGGFIRSQPPGSEIIFVIIFVFECDECTPQNLSLLSSSSLAFILLFFLFLCTHHAAIHKTHKSRKSLTTLRQARRAVTVGLVSVTSSDSIYRFV